MTCKIASPFPAHFQPHEFRGTFPNVKVIARLKDAPNISGTFDVIPDNIAKCFTALSPRSRKVYQPNIEVAPIMGHPSTASIVIKSDKIRKALLSAFNQPEGHLASTDEILEESKEEPRKSCKRSKREHVPEKQPVSTRPHLRNIPQRESYCSASVPLEGSKEEPRKSSKRSKREHVPEKQPASKRLYLAKPEARVPGPSAVMLEEFKEPSAKRKRERGPEEQCALRPHLENAKLIRTQQRFRKGCWRMASTKTGTFLVSISTTGEKSGSSLAARILDPQLDVRKWRSTIVTKDKISRVFTSTSNTLDELITNLKKSQILKSLEVERAFHSVDRALFGIQNPYHDCAVDIGDKELGVCISSPHMHAWAAELLLPVLKNAQGCLDVGSGSGFFTIMLKCLAHRSAQVYGLEYHNSLIETSLKTLHGSFPRYARDIQFLQGIGERGCPGKQFDAIHVGFMCEELPLELIEQLRPGGRLLVPIWDGKFSSFDKRCVSGQYTCVDKLVEGFQVTELFTCSFVPSVTFAKGAEEEASGSPLSLASMSAEGTEISPLSSASDSTNVSNNDLGTIPPFSI